MPKRNLLRIGLGLVILGGLYLVYGARPLVAEPWQWADDGLYLRQAEAFVSWLNGANTPWLGAYDPVLLSKAPLFAVTLGCFHLLHLPLRLAEFSMLLVLPYMFAAAVRPVVQFRGGWWVLVAVVLVGLPFLPLEQRLLRSPLQALLGSGCLISMIGLVVRSRDGTGSAARWAGLLGLCFALSYLNREEAIWLIPGVVCALAPALARAGYSRAWRTALLIASYFLAAVAIPIAAVAWLNFQGYGIAVTTMRRAPAFTRAHQVLTSLEPASRIHYVPIPEATRLKAYELSPAFQQLRSHLEGPASDSIAKNPGHLSLNGYPATGREFFVSNFEFVLREAAFQAGARTPAASETLFAKIESELRAAIANGRIHAGSHGPSLLAAPMPGDYQRIAERSFHSLRALYLMQGMDYPDSGVSSGSPRDLQRMAQFTNMNVAPIKELSASASSEMRCEARRRFYIWTTRLEGVLQSLSSVVVLCFCAMTLIRGQT